MLAYCWSIVSEEGPTLIQHPYSEHFLAPNDELYFPTMDLPPNTDFRPERRRVSILRMDE